MFCPSSSLFEGLCQLHDNAIGGSIPASSRACSDSPTDLGSRTPHLVFARFGDLAIGNRLSAARWVEQYDHLSGPNLEVQSAQCRHFCTSIRSLDLGQGVRGEDCVRHGADEYRLITVSGALPWALAGR